MIEKGTLFIRNKDNWGKDLLIFKAKTHTKGVNDMEDVKKFIVYWFERIERYGRILFTFKTYFNLNFPLPAFAQSRLTPVPLNDRI